MNEGGSHTQSTSPPTIADGDGTAVPRIAVKVNYTPKANFALQQNDVPVVREVVVTNSSETVAEDVVIAIRVSSGLARPWESRLARLGPAEVRRIGKVDLQLDAERLVNQLERERVELSVTVTCVTETGERSNVGAWTGPLEILAFNEWPGLSLLPEILAAFVMPNHPAIEPLLAGTRDRLRGATGDPSLDGYQSKSRERPLAIVRAVYEAMQDRGIAYIAPPASYERDGQKVRTADQVLDGKAGTCLDLTLVAASAIEQSGLRPILLLVHGHAFVGAWLVEEHFAEPTVDDAARVLNRVKLGEIAVFEATALCDGRRIDFAAAQALGIERLEGPDEFSAAIDVFTARRSDIHPLPPRVREGTGFAVVIAPEPQPERSASGPVPQEKSRQPSDEPRSRTPIAPKPDAAVLSPEAKIRLDGWKRRLLDLTLRNPLLNFRVTRKVLPLLAVDIFAIEDALALGSGYSIAPRTGVLDPTGPRDTQLERERTGRDIPRELLVADMAAGLLRADLSQEDFDRRAVELFRAARSAIEETGTNTLFLALGSLIWYETPTTPDRRSAPLLLVPVRIERPQAGRYRMVALDEETRVNVTLLEKLSHDFAMDTASLGTLPEDEAGVDVKEVLNGFRRLVKNTPRWEVRETAHLGLFSFAKFMLWSDLDQRLDQVAANPVVRHIICRGASPLPPAQFPDEASLDVTRDTAAAMCPMDADSSQLAAIEAAIGGATFVLQGPPGTGKSQTITNLVARAAVAGKRVLFVAEKMAALSVVQRRLQQAGLGPFVLELHSAKSGKKEVLEQIRQALDSPSPDPRPSQEWDLEVGRLYATRDALNSYVRALHAPRASGDTAYEVMGRLAALRGTSDVALVLPDPAGIRASRLSGLRSDLVSLAEAAIACGDVANHPLCGVRLTEWELGMEDRLRTAIAEAVTAEVHLRAALTSALTGATSDIGCITVGSLDFLKRLSLLIVGRPKGGSELVSNDDWEQQGEDLLAIASLGERREAVSADLVARNGPEFVASSADVDGARLALVLSQWASSLRLNEADIQIQTLKVKQILALASLSDCLRRLPQGAESLLSAADWPQTRSALTQTARMTEQCADIRRKIGDRYRADFFAADHSSLRDRLTSALYAVLTLLQIPPHLTPRSEDVAAGFIWGLVQLAGELMNVPAGGPGLLHAGATQIGRSDEQVTDALNALTRIKYLQSAHLHHCSTAFHRADLRSLDDRILSSLDVCLTSLGVSALGSNRYRDLLATHLNFLAQLAKLLTTAPAAGSRLLLASRFETGAAKAREAFGVLRRYREGQAKLSIRWSRSFYDVDVQTETVALQKVRRAGVVSRWWLNRQLQHRLMPHSRSAALPPYDTIFEDLATAGILAEDALLLNECGEELRKLFGGYWTGVESDLLSLEAALDWAERTYKVIVRCPKDLPIEHESLLMGSAHVVELLADADSAAGTRGSFVEFLSAIDGLRQILGPVAPDARVLQLIGFGAEHQQLSEKLNAFSPLLRRVFGETWQGSDTPVECLEHALKWADRVSRSIPKIAADTGLDGGLLLSGVGNALASHGPAGSTGAPSNVLEELASTADALARALGPVTPDTKIIGDLTLGVRYRNLMADVSVGRQTLEDNGINVGLWIDNVEFRQRIGLACDWVDVVGAAFSELAASGALSPAAASRVAEALAKRSAMDSIETHRVLGELSSMVAVLIPRLVECGLSEHAPVLLDASRLGELRKIAASIKDSDARCSDLLGVAWESTRTNWRLVREIVAWAKDMRGLLAMPPAWWVADGSPLNWTWAALREEGGIERSATLTALVSAIEHFAGAFGRLLSLARLDLPSGSELKRVEELLARLASGIPSLPEWCRWRRTRDAQMSTPLGVLVEALEAGRLATRDTVDAFEAAFALLWLKQVMASEPALRDFTRDSHEHRVDDFVRLDVAVMDRARLLATARLSDAVPRHSAGTYGRSEMAVLRRELGKQRRHLPVRRLVRELPTLLPRLKPIWLMSPLSVAQYLDPSVPPFDLVIFDEASQIPAWDAVGALARGAQAVIVGDSKQLPPTAFFQRQEDPDAELDESAIEEVESILDECKAAGLPDRSLCWHYRSRHESLIAFSNRHYYNDRLLTFPSAHERAEGLGVSQCYLSNGRYDRSATRTNEVEAKAVVADVVRRLLSGDRRSIGVVTFSAAQQGAIEDLLDEERRKSPELEPFFSTDHPEPVFVKNLENVQGDERDVILFSICYGPDVNGRMSLLFGPLNRPGGERRLNVAITRARDQVVVFSSIRADDIDLSRSRAMGVEHLKAFLDYAERGTRVLDEVGRGDTDLRSPDRHPLAEIIGRVLRQRGWQIEADVGCSGYRIDLAVRDSKNHGRFLLGIQCDGPYYRDAKTARDRDRLRHKLLTSLGWRIHRIWATDWLRDPDGAVRRLEEAIRGLDVEAVRPSSRPPAGIVVSSTGMSASPTRLASAVLPPVVPSSTGPSEPTRKQPDGTKFYTRHEFHGTGRGPDAFYEPRADMGVSADLAGLVEVEGPIHVDRAFARVANAWRLQRTTSRVIERLEDVCVRNPSIVRRGDFLWPVRTTPSMCQTFRIPYDDDELIPLEQIAAEEIGLAVMSVLRGHGGMPQDELERHVARLFGYQRPSTAARERVATVVRDMIVSRGLQQHNDSVQIAR